MDEEAVNFDMLSVGDMLLVVADRSFPPTVKPSEAWSKPFRERRGMKVAALLEKDNQTMYIRLLYDDGIHDAFRASFDLNTMMYVRLKS